MRRREVGRLNTRRRWRGYLPLVLLHLHHARRVVVCHVDTGAKWLSRSAAINDSYSVEVVIKMDRYRGCGRRSRGVGDSVESVDDKIGQFPTGRQDTPNDDSELGASREKTRPMEEGGCGDATRARSMVDNGLGRREGRDMSADEALPGTKWVGENESEELSWEEAQDGGGKDLCWPLLLQTHLTHEKGRNGQV